jgi:Superfamily I DNA and RNA helicases
METFLNHLNPVQREAVLHLDNPLIIFAGAGTGKTRVITYRIAHLLNSGIPPHHILAVTFTNKAAEEMRRRVDALVPGRGRSVWISTFHSFCAQFLRVEAKSAGLDPSYIIYDASDQKNLLRDCVKELNLDEKKFKPGHLAEVISRAKDDLLDADSFGIHALASGDYIRQMMATIYGLYQRKLTQANALDFGDLLMRAVLALRENEALREKYQERFRYILVDEYQDTNHAQYMLTKYLSGKYKNICVVGDDDQSIYSWRGADIRNILEFERDYPGCRMVKLEQNYRSTTTILNAAWQVVKNNEKRVEKSSGPRTPRGTAYASSRIRTSSTRRSASSMRSGRSPAGRDTS